MRNADLTLGANHTDPDRLALTFWILQPCLLCAFLRFKRLGQGRELPADVFEEKPPLSDFGHVQFIARGAQRCGKSRLASLPFVTQPVLVGGVLLS